MLGTCRIKCRVSPVATVLQLSFDIQQVSYLIFIVPYKEENLTQSWGW